MITPDIGATLVEFRDKFPDRFLDVVFATPDLRVLPHQEVPWLYEDLVAASDHRPVWVDLEVPGAPTASGAG